MRYARRRSGWIAAVLIMFGAGYRIYLAATLPVGYDEVFVMGVGLDEMHTSAEQALVRTPVTRSTAVTPLWWWLQYGVVHSFGGLSLWALRVLPAALGLLTMIAAYGLGRRAIERRGALYLLGFIALSDILGFTNARGEFSESLSTLLLIIGLALLPRSRKGVLLGLVWLGLLMTGLGKGVFVIGLLVVAEVICVLCLNRERRTRLAGLVIAAGIALLPTLTWLAWANSVFAGGPVNHEAVEAGSVFGLAATLVVNYAQIKAHVVGTVPDAALVYLDARVWPVTAISAPVLIAGLVAAVCQIGRRGFRIRSPRNAIRIALTVTALIGATVVIGRGTLGARYHLMYLPALWMLAALWLGQARLRFPSTPLVSFLFGWAAYVALTTCWLEWDDRKLATDQWYSTFISLVAVLGVAWLVFRRFTPSRRAAINLCALAMAIRALTAGGPIDWGEFARFEPMARSDEMFKLDGYRAGRDEWPKPHGRTLYIDLANYYLTVEPVTPHNLERAIHFAKLETKRVPDDARAWAYLGEALLRSGASVDQIADAWRRSLALEENERLRHRYEQLTSVDRTN